MLRLSILSFKVVHKHTAASSSTSPCSTGQHSFTTGSPSPMWISPPRRSTQAPSFRVSIGQVADAGGGGQGLAVGETLKWLKERIERKIVNSIP